MEEKINKTFEESKRVLTEETDRITGSLTRIFLLSGPYAVNAILEGLIEANKKMMGQLKMKTELEFEEGEG